MTSRIRRIADELYRLGGGMAFTSAMGFVFYRTDFGWSMLAGAVACVAIGFALGICAGPARSEQVR